ncbi:hemolysin XhlA family protein [Bacillus sp. SM2101]|uniref:hemolysin XhlA family protein n=1 Tax=Bacillus sp. SM2101 TaxID=2805366 RepID=UPI0033172F08
MAVAESNIKDIKEDLPSIKNNTTWIIRLIIGAFIMAVLGLHTRGNLIGILVLLGIINNPITKNKGFGILQSLFLFLYQLDS